MAEIDSDIKKKRWNTSTQKALIPNQCQTGDKRGSWDPVGEWGVIGGRVFATSMAAIALQIAENR